MLNIILALNPDTFALDSGKWEIRTSFDAKALRWIDPILEPRVTWARWQEASLKAMDGIRHKIDSLPSVEWLKEYGNGYWSLFVYEDIEMVARIRQKAGLQNRLNP